MKVKGLAKAIAIIDELQEAVEERIDKIDWGETQSQEDRASEMAERLNFVFDDLEEAKGMLEGIKEI